MTLHKVEVALRSAALIVAPINIYVTHRDVSRRYTHWELGTIDDIDAINPAVLCIFEEYRDTVVVGISATIQLLIGIPKFQS